MAVFEFKARDAGGRVLSGRLEAENQSVAITQLRGQGLFIVDLRAAPSARRGGLRLALRRVSRRDLAVFCRQLATMLEAGLPIVASLRVLSYQVENKLLKESIEAARRELEAGRPFHEALAMRSQVFPAIMVYSVEAAELGGVLDEALARLAEHLEREHELEEKIKSALTYPAVVTCVALMAITFLLTFVLPTFSNMLASLHVPLPFPTRLVLGAGSLLKKGLIFLSPLAVAAVYAFYRWAGTEEGRRRLDALILRLPVFGSLHRKAVLSRFSRTLGTLLHSGVPVLQALEVVRRTAGNAVIGEAIGRAQESVRDGISLARPLEESGLFPPMVVEMIAVGEETGSLDALLTKISTFYDREVSETVTRLSSVLEPVLILGLGGIVGLVIISVLLPMFSLMGAMR